ncbi:MAG: hypothetical protein WCI57_04160 [Candidatus Berkelbacteria bacterium]
MEKRKSRRGVEILTERLKYFFDLVDKFPADRVTEIFTDSNGIAYDIQQLFIEINEKKEALVSDLLERQIERFDASTVELMIFLDDVIHFGAISGGFADGLGEFIGTQLFQLDVSPFQSPEPAIKYIKSKLDEVDPEGLWVVEKCDCLDCAISDLPDLIITSPFAEGDEIESQVLVEIAKRNSALGAGIGEAPYIKNMITGAAQLDKPEQKIQ